MSKLDDLEQMLETAIEHELLGALSLYGFSYLGIEDRSTNLIPISYVAQFANKDVGRYVELAYLADRCSTYEQMSLSIREINPKPDDFDYTSLNKVSVPGVELTELEGNIQERLKVCISKKLDLLRSKYLTVLQGGIFESEEFDWGDMK